MRSPVVLWREELITAILITDRLSSSTGTERDNHEVEFPLIAAVVGSLVLLVLLGVVATISVCILWKKGKVEVYTIP